MEELKSYYERRISVIKAVQALGQDKDRAESQAVLLEVNELAVQMRATLLELKQEVAQWRKYHTMATR